MIYYSTLDKDLIRKEFDKKQIAVEFKEKGRKLTYIGLPSEKLTDILEWREFLSSVVAIENAGVLKVHEMIVNASINNILDNLDILRGDLEDTILKGKDENGKKIKYPFDIINFDFYGGIIYKKFRRLEALKKFIGNQVPNNFLLLLTFNIIDSNTIHRTKLLNDIEEDIIQTNLVRKTKIRKVLDWYRSSSTREEYREKIYVNYFLKQYGELNGYDVLNLSPILYRGAGGSTMVHFTSRFRHCGTQPLRHFSKQKLFDIINMKLKEVRDGRIVSCSIQAPRIT